MQLIFRLIKVILYKRNIRIEAYAFFQSKGLKELFLSFLLSSRAADDRPGQYVR